MLARLQQETICHTLELHGFNEWETYEFIQSLGVKRPSHQLETTVNEFTRGNPLFIQEMVHYYLQQNFEDFPLPPKTSEVVPAGAGRVVPADPLHEDHTADERQTPLLERYHELVDKQMLGNLSALERQELDTLKMQLDEIDENDQALQHVAAQMEARRKLVDEQLDKMSTQLKALLEQM